MADHPSTTASPDVHNIDQKVAQTYWKQNVRLMLQLLAVWFIVSFGCGVIFADALDAYSIGGFPLGFWFAQQGAIYVFVALIFIYAWKMHHIEQALHIDDDSISDEDPA